MPITPRPKPIALRIELQEVTPLVWRRVLVSNQWTLASLHGYLQWIMGWTDSHAHEFQVGEAVVAPDWWINEVRHDADTGRYRDELRVSVAAVASELGTRGEFEYRYDMGDGWRHRIVIEPLPVLAESCDLMLPVCLSGENACPPEDVGGPPGYELFLQILGDREHEQHDPNWIWDVRKVPYRNETELNKTRARYRDEYMKVGMKRVAAVVNPEDYSLPEYNSKKQDITQAYPLEFNFFDTFENAHNWIKVEYTKSKSKQPDLPFQ